MALTDAQVGKRIGLTKAEDTDEVKRLHALAVEQLDQALAGAYREMPEATYDECVLRIARTLKDAKSTPGERGQATIEGVAPAFAPRDPLAAVRTIVGQYVVPL